MTPEIFRNETGKPFQEGDVVLVLRDEGKEEGGIIDDIEKSGRVFINYGGVVSLLHDDEQIRMAPEDIREPLLLRLQQNQQELMEQMERATRGLREVLERQRKETFWSWLWKHLI